MAARYCVVDRPGYFGDRGQCYSTHATMQAAKRALGSGYVDECGQRRNPRCIVQCEHLRKGSKIYSDTMRSYAVLA